MYKNVLIIVMSLFVSVGIAAEVTISGKVVMADGESAEGVEVEISSLDDILNGSKSEMLGVDGQYSATYEINDWLLQTRLYDIVVSKDGYETVTLSKVISSSFTLEDVYLVPTGQAIHKPVLSLIAESESGKNIVAWERQKDVDVDYYIIKKKNLNNVFDSVGMVTYAAQYSIFIDENTDKSLEEYYLIQARMNDGTLSLPSNTRKTFQLTLEEDDYFLEDAVEIIFDMTVFDGIDFPVDYVETVAIMRSKDGGEFVELSSKSLEKFTYSDVYGLLPEDTLSEAGTYIYKAIITYTEVCDPSIDLLKSDSGPFSQSISNLAESIIEYEQVGQTDPSDTTGTTEPTDTTGTTEPTDTTGTSVGVSLQESVITVQPIPANNGFAITADGESTFVIYSLKGEAVLEGVFSDKVFIEPEVLSKGVYIITVATNNETKSFRQVVE